MELKINTQLKKYNSDKFVSDNKSMPALSKHKSKQLKVDFITDERWLLHKTGVPFYWKQQPDPALDQWTLMDSWVMIGDLTQGGPCSGLDRKAAGWWQGFDQSLVRLPSLDKK